MTSLPDSLHQFMLFFKNRLPPESAKKLLEVVFRGKQKEIFQPLLYFTATLENFLENKQLLDLIGSFKNRVNN